MTEDSTTETKKLEAPGKKVTPEEFLGPNAKLVDFDDLVSKPTPASEFFTVSLALATCAFENSLFRDFWMTVKLFALCYQTVVCLSCL